VIYLRNWCPSLVIEKTPYKAWFGQLPDLAHLRTLRAKGFVSVKKSNYQKPNPVSEPCQMLGYQGSTNYIVLTDSGITVSNNITFDEDYTCLYLTLYTEGETEEVPAEARTVSEPAAPELAASEPADSRESSEIILDTIVITDPSQKRYRIRYPFPLNLNVMLAYSFLGAVSYIAGLSKPLSYRHAKADPA
jgi:hypothetical protein